MLPVYLGLGSNLGNKIENLTTAIKKICSLKGVKLREKSSFYETTPVGGPQQQDFVNLVVGINTEFSPQELLAEMQKIEDLLGRDRGIHWGPRTIDIDILLFSDKIIWQDNLKIPHALLHARGFMLEPLCEIAPDVKHPILQKTASQLLRALKSHCSYKCVRIASVNKES